ncbi:MAG: winged helix-turn-helix domain-containing protein [Brucellaceae bacterium]|nr:winged helix-turn-helix domain-containing protein [Brucellaceae bacterium]
MTHLHEDDEGRPVLRLRVMRGDDIVFGPGKAALLESIEQTGSILAAGKAMGMSYKRAWQLVETMNRLFREPVVERMRGGADRGGARLTEAGVQALALYRRIQAEAKAASNASMAELKGMLVDP